MPEDKKIHLPFDDDFSNPEPEDEKPTQKFWDGVAKTLDQIEKNTRGAKNSASGKSNVKSSQSSSPAEGNFFPPAPPKTPRQDVSRKAPVAVPAKAQKAPNPSRQAAQSSKAEKKQAQPITVQAVVKAQPAKDSLSAEKKRYTAEVKRLEAISKQQTNSLLKQLKTSLSKWDGSIGGAKLNMSSIGDLTGTAIGGPFWTAFKELKELVIKDGASSEKTLGDLLKKALPRKPEEKPTGPTRNNKGQFISRNPQELKLAEESHELAKGEVASNKKRHDELIKAVKANHPQKGLFGRNGLLDDLRGRGRNKAGRGPKSVPIPDVNVPHGSKTTARPMPDVPNGLGGKSVKAKNPGRKMGIFAGLAGLLGGGALAMKNGGDGQTALDAASTSVDAAQTVNSDAKTATVEKTVNGTLKTAENGAKAATTTSKAATIAETGAGKAANIGGKAVSLGSKGALGAAKAIPVAGQLLAAGMAVYDGVNGWNDAEMHKEAFSLEEGQEASTGQKASAAAANVLDMGGLLTGAAGLLGFDVNTADIAKGIYDVGDTVAEVVAHPIDSLGKAAAGLFDGVMSWFGGDEKKEENKPEAVKKISSSESPAKPAKEETPKKEDAANIPATAAVVAATTGVAGASLLAAKKAQANSAPQIEKSVADMGGAEAKIPHKTPSSAKRNLAIGAVGALGVTGAAIGAKTWLDKADEDAGSQAASALNSGKIPSLLETLANELSDLNEKLEQQIKQAATGNENSGIFNIFGEGVGGGYAGGYSSSGGGGGYSGGGGSGGGASYSSSAAYSGLGDVVVRSETGGKGTAMISSGAGDHGGVSYGRSQLASKIKGSIGDALNWAKANGFEDIYNELAPLQGDATNRNGQFAQKWAQLAAEKGGRLEQFDRAYQKKGYYDPMMAKIRQANPELAKRIEANPALQEQVLSTAVQYGKNSGRFLSAANEVLGKNANATDRDLVAGIQDIKARDVGVNFRSSSGNVQVGVRNRHANTEKKALLALQDKFERGEIKIDPQSGTAQVSQQTTKNPQSGALAVNTPTSLVSAQSQSIADYTQDAINRHVTYNQRVRNSKKGAVDCSAWVTELNRNYMENINTAMGKEVFSPQAKKAALSGGTAAGIIQNVSQATGELMTGDALAPQNVREGMAIGIKAGKGNNGRFKGIDHIAQVYRDPKSGEMMVSHSEGGRVNGVHTESYEKFYSRQMRKGRAMYGVDINKLADTGVLEQDAPGQPQPALAEAKPQETQPQPSPQAQPAPQPEAQIAQKEVKSQAGEIARQMTGQTVADILAQPTAIAETKPATVAPLAQTNSNIPPVASVASVAPPQPQASTIPANSNLQQDSLSTPGNMLALAKNFMPANQKNQNEGIFSVIEPIMGKAREAISTVSSPKTLLDKYLPKEAKDIAANIQNVAGDMAPLAGSLGKLLPDSAGSFMQSAQSVIGKIANPAMPNPSQLFAQPMQMASNFIQAMPQIPTRLPTPQPIMPTQVAQQGNGLDLGRLEKIMSELLDVTRQNTRDKEKDTEDQNTSNIPMDFEDAYCFQFAHDIA